MTHYHSGWDAFSPEPGTEEAMRCRVCGDDMDVRRNVDGPTSSIEAMFGRKHPHDTFTCKNSAEEWHQQALALMKEQKNTKSAAIQRILEGEIQQILEERKPTEGWEGGRR